MPDGPDTDPVIVATGFAPEERGRAAALFWQAFGAKLGPLLAPEDKAVAFLAGALCPRHAISARAADGRLLGIAGYKMGAGGLVGGGVNDLAKVYGWVGALWRGTLLSLLERRIAPGTALVDGIFVDERARGQGVGSALVEEIKHRARQDGRKAVRLEVAERNTRARALYERHGFVALKTTRAGPARCLIGYRRSIEMLCDL